MAQRRGLWSLCTSFMAELGGNRAKTGETTEEFCCVLHCNESDDSQGHEYSEFFVVTICSNVWFCLCDGIEMYDCGLDGYGFSSIDRKVSVVIC